MLRQLFKDGAKVVSRSAKQLPKTVTVDGLILTEAQQDAIMAKQLERNKLAFEGFEAARRANDHYSDLKRQLAQYVVGGAGLAVATAGINMFTEEYKAKRKMIFEAQKQIEDMGLAVDKIIAHQLKGAINFAKEDHEKVLQYRRDLNLLARKYNKNDNIIVSARDVLLKITEAYENDDIELSAQERVVFRVTPEIQAMYRKKPQGFFAGTAAQALALADSSDSLDDDSVRSVMLPSLSNNS